MEDAIQASEETNEYKLAGVTVRTPHSPETILVAAAQQSAQHVAAALQQQGQFEAARQMLERPNPFATAPQALAILIGTVIELRLRDERIKALEARVEGLESALALMSNRHGGRSE